MNKVVISRQGMIKSLMYIVSFLLLFGFVGVVLQYVVGSFRELGVIESKIINTFDFAREGNMPALFNTLLMALIALFLIIIWKFSGDELRGHSWLFLGILALLLAYDEYAGVHESIARNLPDHVPQLYFVIPYAITAIVVGLLFLPIFLKLDTHLQILMISAAVIWVIGAMDSLRLVANAIGLNGESGVLGTVATIGEELLEMFGLIMLANALGSIVGRFNNITLEFCE